MLLRLQLREPQLVLGRSREARLMWDEVSFACDVASKRAVGGLTWHIFGYRGSLLTYDPSFWLTPCRTCSCRLDPLPTSSIFMQSYWTHSHMIWAECPVFHFNPVNVRTSVGVSFFLGDLPGAWQWHQHFFWEWYRHGCWWLSGFWLSLTITGHRSIPVEYIIDHGTPPILILSTSHFSTTHHFDH